MGTAGQSRRLQHLPCPLYDLALSRIAFWGLSLVLVRRVELPTFALRMRGVQSSRSVNVSFGASIRPCDRPLRSGAAVAE